MGNERLQWGILGAGGIARVFARGVRDSDTGQLVAVGSRAQQTADAFGEEFALARRYASYEALLADPAVQAVYVAVPHPWHAEWAIKAAEAGKHVLCEKPLTMHYPQAMAVVEAARQHDVFLMEAFMYRCHPQTAALVRLVRDGVIGQVQSITATYSFATALRAESRLFNQQLGGGGILDVGCYPLSMVRLLAGAATGKPFAEPLELKAVGRIGETRVDEYTVAVASFPGGILAQLTAGIRVRGENIVRVVGSEGTIVVPEPWVPGRAGAGSTVILLQRHADGVQQEIRVEATKGLYAYEADTVAAHLADRQAPAMPWEDSLGNSAALDQWRAAIGLTYDLEQPGAVATVTGRPLAVRARRPIPTARIEGINKSISRLVLGVDNQRTAAHAAVLFDDFFEQGGTCYDTAYVYLSGQSERLLGHWVASRGVREQVVILDKGAHTPFCTPEHLVRQLQESLERLRTGYVDLYMMHRDNPDVPVGEFLDVLNEQLRAGRLRRFGASNWSIARLEEAQAYAHAHGLQGFSAVSNNLSLAEMIQPPWVGCLSASDPDSLAWFARTGMPLFPWSSQARGFFTGRAKPDDHSDAELVRCWYSEANFARLARAQALAQQRGVQPINIALAYVLAQPFPTFPLIGPRTLAELHSSLQALEVQLSAEEVRWLREG